jgi:hypothetical protein
LPRSSTSITAPAEFSSAISMRATALRTSIGRLNRAVVAWRRREGEADVAERQARGRAATWPLVAAIGFGADQAHRRARRWY